MREQAIQAIQWAPGIALITGLTADCDARTMKREMRKVASVMAGGKPGSTTIFT